MENENEVRLPEKDLHWRIWEETKKTWRIAFPAILFKVTAFGMVVVTQSFVGHIGRVDLAAYALIQTVLLFANGVLVSSSSVLMPFYFKLGHLHLFNFFLVHSFNFIFSYTVGTVILKPELDKTSYVRVENALHLKISTIVEFVLLFYSHFDCKSNWGLEFMFLRCKIEWIWRDEKGIRDVLISL